MNIKHFVFILNTMDKSNFEKLIKSISKENFKVYFFLSEMDLKSFEEHKTTNDKVKVLRYNSQSDTSHTVFEQNNISPEEAAFISDDPKNIKYFRKLGVAYCLGIGDNPKDFYHNYADDVLDHISKVKLKDINKWIENHLEYEKWCLVYKHFDKEEEKLRETLTTVGNGFVGHRNAISFMKADNDTHYPGTYVAGLFNKVPTKIADREIFNNDFVNIPNAFLIEFKFDDDSENWHSKNLKLINYEHRLNMKTGEATRTMILEHQDGRQVHYTCQQFAGMHNMHILGHNIKIVPLNFEGELKLSSSIDGDIINYGVPRYRKLNGHHFDVKQTLADKNYINLKAETTASNVEIDLCVYHNNQLAKHSEPVLADKTTKLLFKKTLEKKQGFELERTIYIETSRNQFHGQKKFVSYDTSLKKSKAAWSKIWNNIDIEISGDRYAQELVRMQLYHLICSASPNNTKIDAGITARGLHGEAYRGHIFWDELFILPFYFKNYPEVAKSIMMYRYRRLDAARRHAKKNNKEGALIPWQIADTGEEETQEIHYNPMSKEWDPDLSRKQRHVSISVAFNIINYYKHTQDDDFLSHEGGEMLLEILRYWASKVRYNKSDKRYHIYRVMGPDEFHEKYPENPVTDGGIDDNAYTNIMVSWLFSKAVQFLPKISTDVKEKINFNSKEETHNWNDIKNKLFVSIKDNIIEQFDGYFDLKEIDWQLYKEKYDDIGRMDRILKSENDSPDHYKVAKQADTLMLFYLLESEELVSLLNQLGYDVENPEQFLINNFDYYIKRTSHGSTLSYVVHAYLLDEIPNRDDDLWKWFHYALNSDFDDIQGGTTEEGIHCGVMAGNINLIYNCFAGIKMGNTIKLNPNKPKHWKNLSLKIKFQNIDYRFEITDNKIKIKADSRHNMKVRYKDKVSDFLDSDQIIFSIV
ncbi:MAG: beta-phosphoglucomutase [Bacteroidetes bacterium]|jgi:trehalose/maltose hydrolase-like predicted phosphorylase|nr:beta-phosphoglucomutase [Bacteroidota bacterium]